MYRRSANGELRSAILKVNRLAIGILQLALDECGFTAGELYLMRAGLELSALNTLPANQRSLVADGQPVVQEITVAEIAKQESQPAHGVSE